MNKIIRSNWFNLPTFAPNYLKSLTFDFFNFHEAVASGIAAMGYKTPTPIQQQAIPLILQHKDLIACAQTGTGKTGAFLIPLLNKLSENEGRHNQIKCLVLVPTRELAKQIDEQIEGFAYFCPVTSVAVYGGGSGSIWEQQRKGLENGADIVVATPGRLIAHLQMGYVKLDKLDCLVLDEADKMLDMGFYEDLMKIISQIPGQRQTLLFSATMPPKIRELAKRILKHPEQISLAPSKPAEGIEQSAYLVHERQKIALLEYLFQEKAVESMLIFTSRKSSVNQIERALQKLKFKVGGIQSDKTQEERETILRDFKGGKINVLVATDILSRGIDIEGVSHVINYDIPHDAEDYVHRIGRTARASATGTAITFISEKDQFRIRNIERLIEKEIPKLSIPAALGSGPQYNPKLRTSSYSKKRFSRRKTS